jgi:hypothetical protein
MRCFAKAAQSGIEPASSRRRFYHMNAITQKIKYVSIESLTPDEANPRLIRDRQFQVLCESIKKNPDYFEARPILCNAEMKIFAGHMRWLAAKEIGMAEVPVAVMDIPKKRQKELMLRDNVSNGAWDWEKLANNFEIDELTGVGFDEELSFMFDDVMTLGEDNFDLEKVLKEITNPETKPGEIIKLGNHFLMCGDSMKPEDVAKLMGEAKTSFIFSDPPYNIGLDYSKGISTEGKYKGSFSATKDKKSSPDYRAFIDTAVKNALIVATKDAHVFFWCDENFVGKMQGIFEGNGITNRRTCLWIKNNFNMTPQVAFNKVYEPCVYGTIGSPSHRD